MPPKKNIEPEFVFAPPIAIELGENTLQVLRDLTQAIVSQKAPVINLKSVDSTVLEALVKGLSQAPTVAPAPAPVAPKPKGPTALEPKMETATAEYPAVSLTQIREMINLKVGEGKQPAIVALLKEHGAKNASTLDEEHFVSFYNGLTEL